MKTSIVIVLLMLLSVSMARMKLVKKVFHPHSDDDESNDNKVMNN